ncbi:hypothetical protein B0H14DRAFT_2801267, partial [Mycena olivaceomarginata]
MTCAPKQVRFRAFSRCVFLAFLSSPLSAPFFIFHSSAPSLLPLFFSPSRYIHFLVSHPARELPVPFQALKLP